MIASKARSQTSQPMSGSNCSRIWCCFARKDFDWDTLEGSRHANMKELRVKVLKVQWRFAFAFDPERKAVVLCGGAKSGVSQKLFYKRLIDLADKRYDEHLSELEKKHG